MPSDLVGAVVQALEQQQSAASGSETPPVVQIVDPTRGSLDGGIPAIGDPGHDSQFCGLLKQSMISRQLRGS